MAPFSLGTGQQGLDEAADGVTDLWLCFSLGMDAIIHHEFRAKGNIIEKEGHQWQLILCRQRWVNLLELLDIASAIVGRQPDLGQDDLGIGCVGGSNHGSEVALGDGGGKTAQAIVTTELNQYPLWLVLAEQGRQARECSLGRFSTDAGIDQLMLTALLPFGGQQRWPAFLKRHLVAGAKAVTENKQALGLRHCN